MPSADIAQPCLSVLNKRVSSNVSRQEHAQSLTFILNLPDTDLLTMLSRSSQKILEERFFFQLECQSFSQIIVLIKTTRKTGQFGGL